MFNDKTNEYIIDLARRSITNFLNNGVILEIDEQELPHPLLLEQRSCFVTLKLGGKLRGCIGHIEPIQELYRDIIENSVSAAFEDPRFLPLRSGEFNNLHIEVSVLTRPVKIQCSDASEIIQKLNPDVDGVIIKKGNRGATYLPQVWSEFSTPQEFLSSLCLKAGLLANEWEKGTIEVSIYQAEIVE
ncbi:MAG: AmmeMemoRadiSam system protein A [bacterium]